MYKFFGAIGGLIIGLAIPLASGIGISCFSGNWTRIRFIDAFFANLCFGNVIVPAIAAGAIGLVIGFLLGTIVEVRFQKQIYEREDEWDQMF